MKRIKKTVIIMIITCLLLGATMGGSKQEDVKGNNIVEIQLCEGKAEANGELL